MAATTTEPQMRPMANAAPARLHTHRFACGFQIAVKQGAGSSPRVRASRSPTNPSSPYRTTRCTANTVQNTGGGVEVSEPPGAATATTAGRLRRPPWRRRWKGPARTSGYRLAVPPHTSASPYAEANVTGRLRRGLEATESRLVSNQKPRPDRSSRKYFTTQGTARSL